MQVIVAKNLGFCFGVRRAVEIAEKQRAPVFTYGNIIHNEQVVQELRTKGIVPVSDLETLAPGDSLVIRAHGAPPELFAVCAEKGIAVVDATCPYVKRIHRIVEQAGASGQPVFIAGKPDHPEVVGIAGWAGQAAQGCTEQSMRDTASQTEERDSAAGGVTVSERVDILKSDAVPESVGVLESGVLPQSVTVLESVAEVAEIPAGIGGCLVCQTTLPHETFREIAESLAAKRSGLIVHNTICDTTRARQKEAEDIAARCTRVLVLGSKSSANTLALERICKKHCKNVETIGVLKKKYLDILLRDDIIGLVAGASTPDRMITEVLQRMSEETNVTIENPLAEAPAEVIAETTEPIESETVDTAVEESVAVEEPATEEAEAVEEPAAEEAEAVEEPVAEAEPVRELSEFEKAFEETVKRIRPGQIMTGTVLQIVDGEVFVNIGYKSDGVIPKGEFATDADVNVTELVKEGDSLEVEVVKVNDGEGNVLLSRKSIEGRKMWDDLMGEDVEGKVFETVVKEVVKGGLLADVSGIRVFVPASHISTRYIENLNTLLGTPLSVKVLEVDRQKRRIVASAKHVMQAAAVAERKEKWAKLEVGAKVSGVVRRITDFGAFVDIGGLDGLVHVTDAGWGRVKHPSDVLKVGQEIEVLILNTDEEKGRISLGYKQLQPKPWTRAAETYPIGTIVDGKVVRLVPFGAFVSLEPTIDGLIHISQVAERRVEKVEDALKVGESVRCKVLEVNVEAKRISLSRREAILEEHPEIAEQLAAEKAERERLYQERKAEREQQQQQPQQQQRPERRERDTRRSGGDNRGGDRPDRRRRNEDADYDLPPVQEATTSLAALFANIKLDDDSAE